MPTISELSLSARDRQPAPRAPRLPKGRAGRRALSVPEQNAWREIEGAPRDGSTVDLWTVRGVRLTDCWWEARAKCWQRWDVDPFAGAGIINIQEKISHWRPISGPDADLGVSAPDKAGWILTSARLPEDRGEPYQVIAASNKELGGNYKGAGEARILPGLGGAPMAAELPGLDGGARPHTPAKRRGSLNQGTEEREEMPELATDKSDIVKYRARWGTVERVHARSETDKTIILANGCRAMKASSDTAYYDTFAEAKNHLVLEAENSVENAQRALEKAKKKLERAQSLCDPLGDEVDAPDDAKASDLVEEPTARDVQIERLLESNAAMERVLAHLGMCAGVKDGDVDGLVGWAEKNRVGG